MVQKEKTGRGEWTLTLSGRIDNNTSSAMREGIASVPQDAERLILDFRDVTYISSAGLRELLICRHRFPDDRMILRNVGSAVMEVIHMVGFDEFLPIEKTERGLLSTFVNISLKGLLDRLAQDAGDRIALKNGQNAYTWAEIEKSAQIIAEDLHRKGVAPGAHVGICGGNSVNWVMTFFAVQKLNAMAMLINPALTAGEIGQVCRIGDITCLCLGDVRGMTDREAFMAEIRQTEGCGALTFYSFAGSPDLRERYGEYEALKGKFAQTTEPDAPRVVIFTSGSTGRPKGVILSSFNLLNASAVQVRLQKMTSRDREILIVPLFHILGLVVCLLPCAMMLTPLYIPADIHAETLIRAMDEEQFTLAHAVPTMLIKLIGNEDYRGVIPHSLRCTMLAGSRIDEEILRKFRTALPNNHFMVAYGLSEMAPVSQTMYDDSEEHLLHTVGKQVENIRIRIVNPETGEECPCGEAGEILVQGFNLMTGYYKLPLQEQSIDGEGWLHTGDMGSLSADGYLTLRGRYKELIIRGGENIMPAEVEKAVAALPEVREAHITGVTSSYYGEEVAACISLTPGAAWDEEKAKKALRKTLARYKIPTFFLVYDSLPRLASGKIDSVQLRRDAEASQRD